MPPRCEETQPSLIMLLILVFFFLLTAQVERNHIRTTRQATRSKGLNPILREAHHDSDVFMNGNNNRAKLFTMTSFNFMPMRNDLMEASWTLTWFSTGFASILNWASYMEANPSVIALVWSPSSLEHSTIRPTLWHGYLPSCLNQQTNNTSKQWDKSYSQL